MSMTHRPSMFGSLVAATVAVVLTLPASAEPAKFHCNKHCMDGEYGGCSSGQHYIYQPESPWFWNAQGSVHNCLQNSCAQEHACSDPEVPLENLAAAIAAGNVRQLGAFLKAHSKSLILNKERVAFQVAGCSGRVVAHLPTSKAVIEALSSVTTD